MKNKFKLFGTYLPVFIVALLATVTLRSVSLMIHFNFDTSYFTDKVLITVSSYALFVFTLFFFSYIFFAPDSLSFIPDFTSHKTYIPTGIVSAATLFMVFSLTKTLFESPISPSERIFKIVSAICIILSIASVVYFVTITLIEKTDSEKRAKLGISTVLFLSIYAIYIYFGNDFALNSPNKIVDEMAFLFTAVFFLYETRLSLGREKWKHYIAFGFIAALLTAYSSVPSLIVYFAKGETISSSIYETVLCFSLFIFIISRLILTSELIEKKTSPVASGIIALSDKRQNDLTPKRKNENVIEIMGEALSYYEEKEPEEANLNDENQISIDDIDNNIVTDSNASDANETDGDTAQKKNSEGKA